MSHAVPVFQGFAIPNSIRRIDVAGRDVTEHLQQLLRKSGRVFHTSAEKETVRQIKEETAYVALDPAKEEKEWSGSSRTEGKSVEYELPDGQKLKVGQILKQQALHVLTPKSRSGRSAFEPPKSSSIPKSSGSSTLACIRSSWKQFTGPTWTCERPYTATLCCPAAPR